MCCRRIWLRLLAGIAFALTTACLPASGQAKRCLPLRSTSVAGLSFRGGEKFTFATHYKWGPVNSDVAKVYVTLDSTQVGGVPVYHCRVFGQTARFYDMFFKVREDFQSWFTCDGLRPVRFTRDTREGGYTCTNKYRYVRNVAEPYIAASVKTSRKGAYSARIPLTDCTYDIPSLFYMARNIDFSKIREGDNHPITFAIDEDTYTIGFIYRGKTERKVSGVGTVRCHLFSVGVVAGNVFPENADSQRWISDDDNRIPVWFETPINPGTVRGRLQSWSGLKYPFNALVK